MSTVGTDQVSSQRVDQNGARISVYKDRERSIIEYTCVIYKRRKKILLQL
jgi:hypothetical protein